MNPQKPKSGKPSSESEPPNPKQIERKESNDSVDEASRESFPASDSPAWSIPSKRRKR